MDTLTRISALLLTASFSLLTACSPPSSVSPVTGNVVGAAAGGGLGYGFVSAFGGPRVLTEVTGASIGYYYTTLRAKAGGIYHAGGQVFAEGDYLTIVIPTDTLFDTDTADLLPNSDMALSSVVDVLRRYPNNNILITVSTNGFAGNGHYAKAVSENRARKIATVLWSHGLNEFRENSTDNTRRLNYLGLGNRAPILKTLKSPGFRGNARVQITAYPSHDDLFPKDRPHNLANIGEDINPHAAKTVTQNGNSAFNDVELSGVNVSRPHFSSEVQGTPLQTDIANAFKDEPQVSTPVPKVSQGSRTPPNYNSEDNRAQTRSASSAVKQAGYKGEGDFKGELAK